LPEGVEVMPFDGLAVAAAQRVGARLLLRGVRGPEDTSSELQMSRANRLLDPGVETLLLLASVETAHISSRLVREVHRSGGDVSLFVPPLVAAALAERTPGR
jgi:pantetheine-phosphate adenylyltransferase